MWVDAGKFMKPRRSRFDATNALKTAVDFEVFNFEFGIPAQQGQEPETADLQVITTIRVDAVGEEAERTIRCYKPEERPATSSTRLVPVIKGWTIHAALQNGNVEYAQGLLKARPELAKELTLKESVRIGDLDLVKRFLMVSPVQATTNDEHGLTLLHYAAMEGHKEVAEFLIGHGATVDVPDDEGQTPLWLAAAHGRTGVVKLLISLKAEPNVKSKDGVTPLHVAARGGHGTVVQLLLDDGADPDAKAFENRKPSQWAIDGHHEDIAGILRKRENVE
jgi:ankyrin repeat protein